MAYILGFFVADGTMTKNRRGAHFITFENTDKGIVYAIREILQSTHKIRARKRDARYKTAYRLQIGSKEIFQQFLRLGITPLKAKRICVPKIPGLYIKDFIRGYFDGDRGICYYLSHKSDRRTPTPVLATTFTSCSREFLDTIATLLRKKAGMRIKRAIAKPDGGYELQYSTNDSRALYHFLYQKVSTPYLRRKRMVFEKYLRA